MATHDYVIDNQSAPTARADINNVLQAIVTNNSGASAPSVTFAGMWWLDTTNNYLKMRDKDNAAWVIVGEFDITNDRFKLISDSIKAASAGGIDVLNSSGTKIIDLQVASQATAEAGTNNTELMTPLRTAQSVFENAVIYPKIVTILQSGTSYVLPSTARAVLIRASGGGGGGSAYDPTFATAANGFTGGTTTVTNAALGINIVAEGGARGVNSTNETEILNASSGGDVLRGSGAAGGSGDAGNNITANRSNGRPANLVTKYVIDAANVAGATLTYAIGAGGAAGTVSGASGEAGMTGFVEIWAW